MKNIFFDFDDVLFDTRSFIEDLICVFEKCGVTRENFHASCEKSRTTNVQHTYDFDEHMKILCEDYVADYEALQKSVAAFIKDTRRYLYSDSLTLIKKLSRKHRVFIVSYGRPYMWQHDKIEGSGLFAHTHGHAVGAIDKGAEVKSFLATHEAEESYFIDDRVSFIAQVKKASPQVITILMKRPEARYSDDLSQDCDHEALDAQEIEKIILRDK